MNILHKVNLLFLTGILCVCSSFTARAETITPKFQLPILVTSAGQSIEAQMVSFNCIQAKVTNKCNQMAVNKDLEGIKTLIIVPGHSLKGLGSAGIDANMELARVKSLVEQAKKRGIAIVCIHVGGAARRGPTSKPFIDAALENAKYCVVYADGNQDGYFTKQCQAKRIPLTVISKVADLTTIVKKLFK